MLRISDPYREWLGVEVDEFPPDAYTLLRLPLFETSVNKIRQAAEQQRQRMERCRRQADGEQWDEVSRQLEEAIRTLLEPGRKSEFDLAIKRRQVIQNKSLPMAAPIGDESRPVTCGGCGQENAAGRRFCAGCGDPLWIECLGCATVCASNEKFCGSCGENQGELLARARQKNQALMDRAKSLSDQHLYAEAIAALTPLIEQTHRQLHEQIGQAAELIESFIEARRQHTQRTGDLQVAAREALQSGHYSQALQLLEQVPETLRDAAFASLLQEAQQKNGEVRRLKREVAESIQQQQYSEAAHRIERLLSLTPDDEKVEQVGRNLSKHLVQAAARQLQRGQYQACLDLLGQIPERYREANLERKMETVRELHWLHSTLQRAPYADPVLVEAARRLCTDAPKNEQAARLRQRLDERIRSQADKTNGRLPAPVPWASLPRSSSLEIPIDWETGLGRLQISDADARAAWIAHPGQFYTAAGLALQGLGRASISLDLKPRKRGGVLGSLSLVSSRKATVKAAWGLDLGASSLKAVRLTFGPTDDQVVVDKSVWLPVHRHAALRNGSEMASSALTDALHTLVEQYPLAAGEPVIANISSLKLLGRFLRLPRLEGKRFQQVLEYEIRHRIPVPIEDLSWDHHVLPEAEEVYGEVPKAILVIAAKQFEVERRLAVFDQAGIQVDGIQSDATALHNWFQFDQASRSTAGDSHPDPAVALIDVGSDASQLIISWGHSFWFRVLATGGDDVSRTLVKEFRLTMEQAEQLKCNPAKARRLSKLFTSIDPIHIRLRTQLKQSLEAFHQDYPEIAVQRGIGIGGGFQLHGLLHSLYATA